MKRFISWLFGGRLLYVLISSLVLVAILTGVLNTLVISRVINDYLANAQSDRVDRDLDLANGFYRLKLHDVAGIGERTVVDTQLIDYISPALENNQFAVGVVGQVIGRKVTVPMLGGSLAILVLDRNANVLAARTLSSEGQLSDVFTSGNWGQLPIVVDTLASSQQLTGTEIIPASLLAQIGLEDQAFVQLRETPQSAPNLFDEREGTAGMALMGVMPLHNESGQMVGVVVTAYVFNNDYSFVDSLKDTARIDTATVFLGDLRVSTNVTDQNGERAVGTRVSQVVYDQVLVQGQEYLGRVFVVDSWYIGRYGPIRDYRDNVIGMLYVGVRESVFKDLVDDFTKTAMLVALFCILVAGVLAFPIARLITRPIGDLAEANFRVAKGDMNVRVEPFGRGEISWLGQSFNNMADTLRDTQRELLHKEKLASMGQLAAGVAHELNNPLGTILLFSDALYKDIPEDDPRREDLKMIIEEAQRCKIIVADLLNFARQQEVLAQDTNLPELFDGVIARVRELPKFKKVEIVRNFSPGLPTIQADAAQLQQVFINLLDNSADAMDGEGTITVSAHLLDEHTVEFRMADTGSGISPENLDKLFTPFFTTKPAGKGTGLGLAIVYGIIKMHRGQIRLESEEGHGATVVITFPVNLKNGKLGNVSKANLIG